MKGKWKEEIMEGLRSKLKRFEQEQIRKIDRFEQEQIRKIDQKTEEVRVLIKAAEEGRLIDFARLNPDEYAETMRKLCKKAGGRLRSKGVRRCLKYRPQ